MHFCRSLAVIFSLSRSVLKMRKFWRRGKRGGEPPGGIAAAVSVLRRMAEEEGFEPPRAFRL